MSTWAELVAAGFRRIIGVQIEGIPLDFLEGQVLDTGDNPLAVSSERAEVSHALRLREGEGFDVELDRFAGLARGRALTMSFDLSVLATSTIGAGLFKVPTLKATLTTSVASAATTAFLVDSTTGWPDTGAFYIGREYCTYSTRYGASFAGVTRAVAGNAHYHEADAVSQYKFLTNSPIYWRGRLVTVYEHLVGPDGRYPVAGGEVNTIGTFCRELWKGYVDEHPRASARVMTLRALPIERLFAQSIAGGRSGQTSFKIPVSAGGAGTDISGTTEGVLYITTGDKLYVGNLISAITQTGWFPRYALGGAATVTRWAQRVVRDVDTYLSSAVTYFATVQHDTDTGFPTAIEFIFRAEDGGGAREQVIAFADAWFLGPPVASEVRNPTSLDSANQFVFPLTPNQAAVSWMIINLEYDTTGEPQTWPTTGYIRIEGADADQVELARYDTVDTTVDPNGGYIAIRVTERQLMSTPRLNPWAEPCTITVLAGASGTIEGVIRTIATSSGTGARGAYDTLGFAMGLGVPDSWLSLDIFPLNSIPCDAISDEESSLGDIVGGWLALLGLCLCQRQQTDGTVQVEAVPTTVETSGYTAVVTAADVILAAADSEQLADTPNLIRIEDSFRSKKTESVLRDLPRIQAEGSREMSFVAPSITVGDVVTLGTKMLRQADGQLVVTLPVSPAVTLRAGDPCRLDIAHPLLWDWVSGSTAGIVPARVIGVSDDLSGPRRLTFLCPGQAVAGAVLCPAAEVTARGSSTTITVDDTAGFAVGQYIVVYRRGDDVATIVQRQIDAIAGLVITLDSAASVVTYPGDGDTWITFSDAATVTAAQLEQLFVVSGDQFI